MKALFEKLYTFQRHYNLQMVAHFELYGAAIPERDIPLFSHVLNAHQIWNARILGLEPFKVFEVHPVAAMRQIVEDNHKNSLRILEECDLSQRFHYRNSQGEDFSNLIEEILFHVVNHTTYHRGQIMSDFRQAGLEPFASDYSTYTRQ